MHGWWPESAVQFDMLISLIELAASVTVKKILAATDHQPTQKVPSTLLLT